MRVSWTWLGIGIVLGIGASKTLLVNGPITPEGPSHTQAPLTGEVQAIVTYQSASISPGPVPKPQVHTAETAPKLVATSSLDEQIKKLVAQGKTEEARLKLQASIDADPANADAQNRAGDFYLSVMKDPAKALPYLEEAMRLDAGEPPSELLDEPTNKALQTMVDMAISSTDSAVRDRAAKLVQENAASNPASAEAQMAVGDLEMSRGNPDAASRYYQEAAKHGSARAHEQLGDIHMQKGNFSEAVREMTLSENVISNALDTKRAAGQNVEYEEKKLQQAITNKSVALMANGDITAAKELNQEQQAADPANTLLKDIGADIENREKKKVPATGLPNPQRTAPSN